VSPGWRTMLTILDYRINTLTNRHLLYKVISLLEVAVSQERDELR
jgi:hypothetical protein